MRTNPFILYPSGNCVTSDDTFQNTAFLRETKYAKHALILLSASKHTTESNRFQFAMVKNVYPLSELNPGKSFVKVSPENKKTTLLRGILDGA